MEREEVSNTLPEDSEDDKVKHREKMTKTLGEDSQDDQGQQEEETMKTLPEELVEGILAMVAFPFLFKARVLSKSWLARLSPISSQDDEEKKRLAISFQRKVSECSTNWKTFSPVIGHRDIFAYERGSHTWRKLPSLDFLPKRASEKISLRFEGALLLFARNFFYPHSAVPPRLELHVANILTRSWKQLPLAPTLMPCEYFRLVSHTREAYKVVSVHEVGRDGIHLVYIYDSTSSAWCMIKKLVLSTHFGRHSMKFGLTEYLDGVLYIVRTPFDETLEVLAINVKDENLEVLNISLEESSDIKGRTIFGQYPVCRGNLLMVISAETFRLIKFDLKSRQLLELVRGSRAAGYHRMLPAFLSDGDNIFFEDNKFFEVKDGETEVLAYDMHEEDWSSFPYPPSCPKCFPDPSSMPSTNSVHYRRPYDFNFSLFQPGLNPFAAV